MKNKHFSGTRTKILSWMSPWDILILISRVVYSFFLDIYFQKYFIMLAIITFENVLLQALPPDHHVLPAKPPETNIMAASTLKGRIIHNIFAQYSANIRSCTDDGPMLDRCDYCEVTKRQKYPDTSVEISWNILRVLTLTARGSTVDVRIWRLWTSDSSLKSIPAL